MDESYYFCNEWQCPNRKNEIHKNEMLCDLVWDGCHDDIEKYLSDMRRRRECEK